eukprot:TRINITY_DN305_c0_g1_i2.p2 TRINITY_DN305_c0_g1~~TRINITY_DN305_c0_g1_i2.p2  ORF type:complete len:140 (-),score=73.05 TRINITY_DN305_c0_g1_i2:51-470(-)
MKVETCSFSGLKIHPGRGKQFARFDGRTFVLLNRKVQALFTQRRNPRKTDWTVVYRRMHRKGIQEAASKRRTRKSAKATRGIGGMTREELLQKKNEKPEVRAANRDAAIRAIKEKKRAEAAAAAAAKPAKKATKGKGKK